MHTLLKVGDLIDNGVSPELAPFVHAYASGISLRWLGGLHRFERRDLLLLSEDGLPHSFIRGPDPRVHQFKQRGMRFTIDIELDDGPNISFVRRVNLVLANLLAEQMNTADVGLSQGAYTYGITSCGEVFTTTAKVAIHHYSEDLHAS